jgi:hypothetical protein
MVGVRELRRTVGVLGQPPTTIEQEDATISQPQKKEKEKKRKKKGVGLCVLYL